MQFSVLCTVLACATGVFADLHTRGWCADRDINIVSGVESNPANGAVTQKACNRYKARNTGNQQWDKCPGCTTSFRGDLLVCNSPAKHIGGDEWDYYCKQEGADMGKTN